MDYSPTQRRKTKEWVDSIPIANLTTNPWKETAVTRQIRPTAKHRDTNRIYPSKPMPEMQLDLNQSKNMDDMIEELNRIRKEMATQRSRADAMTLKCKKLEREQTKEKEEFQNTLAALTASNSQQYTGGKNMDLMRIITNLKRRTLTLERQLEEKNTKLKSMEGDIKRTKLEEMNGQMEAAYGEIDRLRQLVTLLQHQQQMCFGVNTDNPQITRQTQTELQNARLQKAIRILCSDKKALEDQNAELMRQLEVFRSVPGKKRGKCGSSPKNNYKNLTDRKIAARDVTGKRHHSKGRKFQILATQHHRNPQASARSSDECTESGENNVNVVHLTKENAQIQAMEKQYSDSLAQIAAQRKMNEAASKSTPVGSPIFPISKTPRSPVRELSPPKDLMGPAIFPVVLSPSPRSKSQSPRKVNRSKVYAEAPELCDGADRNLTEEAAAQRIQHAWRKYSMNKVQRSKSPLLPKQIAPILMEGGSVNEDDEFLQSVLEEYFIHQEDQESF